MPLGPAALPALQIHYWGKIARTLQAEGRKIFVARVPFCAEIGTRAEKLKLQLDLNFPNQDINLVAHSMVGEFDFCSACVLPLRHSRFRVHLIVAS